MSLQVSISLLLYFSSFIPTLVFFPSFPAEDGYYRFWSPKPQFSSVGAVVCFPQSVTALRFSPNGTVLASASGFSYARGAPARNVSKQSLLSLHTISPTDFTKAKPPEDATVG